MDTVSTNIATLPQPPHTLTFQSAVNRIVRGLLRTPLVSRVVGARLITVYVVGRKSGRRFAVPVAYTHHNGHLLIGTAFPWVRNLRTGEPVDIRLKGRRRTADATVVTDEAGVVADYATIARDNHQFARFNNISLDSAGEPNPADLHGCWAAGARTVRLSPH
jgi:deazaflavin-dependent oxidoreductase (nitroreductase family)